MRGVRVDCGICVVGAIHIGGNLCGGDAVIASLDGYEEYFMLVERGYSWV